MSEKMIGIFETLKKSIESGLNASLTPEESRELLRMFAMVNMKKTIRPVRKGSSPVEKIVDGVAQLAHGVIEDLAGELKPQARTARRRQRR